MVKKNKKQVNGAQIFNEISDRIKNVDKKDVKVVVVEKLKKLFN